MVLHGLRWPRCVQRPMCIRVCYVAYVCAYVLFALGAYSTQALCRLRQAAK